MQPSDEPLPAGSRREPPPRLRVAVGGAPPSSDYRILIALSKPFESKAFSKAFHKLGWQVMDLFETEEILPAWDLDRFHVVLTDELSFVRVFSGAKGKGDVVAVANENEEAVNEAWTAGADWVVVRPVDPVDPLGFNQR